MAMAASPDGSLIASGDGDGSVRVWDLSAGPERASLQTTLEGSGRVAALAFTDAESRLVIAPARDQPRSCRAPTVWLAAPAQDGSAR